MSFWNILGGAALGVVAVAALPIAGPIGAVTCIGTGLAAAGTGAAAGAVKNKLDEDDKKQAHKEGKNEGKAESSKEIDELKNKLSNALNNLKSMDEHWNALIAMTAVGVSVANCDGDFSDNEREEISGFVHGMMNNSDVPDNVKSKIDEIYSNPPEMSITFELAKESKVDMSVFDDIIYAVMHVDGVKKEEEVFVNAWNTLKNIA